MPILRRDDGITFALQSYRETLTIKNTSLLRKEIRYLAETHGAYMRLFRLTGNEYEAVFSQEAGYLLGETVWHYFEQQDNIIYCERLSKEEHQALLVIVRDGKVYLDAKLPLENIADEISGLLSDATPRYQVYLYGELPVNFVGTAVKKITPLKQSLFNALSASNNCELLLFDNALAEHALGAKKRTPLIVITAVCLMILGGLWWYVGAQQATPKINPFEQYELALQTPAPKQQIASLIKGMQKINTIQGWYPSSFNYNGMAAQVPVHSLGGTATYLMTTAQQMGMAVDFSSQGASLSFGTIASGRSIPDHIANSQQVVAMIIDRMMRILPGKSVEIGNTTENQVFEKTNLTISFSNISPDILQLIGSNLDDLPVTLISCSANIKDGLWSGSLLLAVVGN